MEIIERDGRYFVQCLDGEYETTLDDLKRMAEAAESLKRFSDKWLQTYKDKKWKYAYIPKDAEFHINLEIAFDDIKQYLQDRYHAGDSLWASYQMCDVAIASSREKLCNPYVDADKEHAWIARWQSVREFLNLLPKRGSFDETPPYFPPAPPAKGTPASDVRRYFPNVATIHGSTATDANAVQQLAVWLLHWAERHSNRPSSNEYSLAGRLREQQAVHPNTSKFLKACHRLHEALLPLAADEQGVKQLLDTAYSEHSRTNLVAVLAWWGVWIRDQQAAHDDPARAYLSALQRVPIVEEWENGSPRYNLPTHLGIHDEFEAEITPLRHAFEAVLPELSSKKKRALRASLNELLCIDRAELMSHREQFERGEYGLNFLPADYPTLRFDVAGQIGGFKWQWVSPMFWSGLSTLLHYKQMAAHTASEQLAATLPEGTKPSEIFDTPPATPLLTPATVRSLYLKLLEHPSLVSELSAYQQSELRGYAEAEQLVATRLAVRLRAEKPHYDYPASYLNGREVEYWQGTITSYADSKQVLSILTPPATAATANTSEQGSAVTVAGLCRGGFTPYNLSELLVRLSLIDDDNNCLTNNLRGKAQGRRGAFTAAYRVLHRAGLLAPTATDREWADAFKKEYKAELGTDVIAHQLTSHGHAASLSPGPFRRAVTDAAAWVDSWKAQRLG